MDKDYKKSVCIVGGGVCGLLAIKCCLDEGLYPVCLERSEHYGGLWNYQEQVTEEQACVMKSTITNTSKEFMAFSDFPPPKEFPVYMHNKKVYEYFKLYAENFDLLKHIEYNSNVTKVEKNRTFDATGRWNITYRQNGKENTVTFDAVMVCNGHFATKYNVTYEGEDTFPGKVMHGLDYRVPEGFENKNVVIVGMGNSGLDVAVELAYRSKQVYISARHQPWIMSRIADGVLLETIGFRRFSWWVISNLFPKNLLDSIIERKMNQTIDHKLIGLNPKHRATQQAALINDDIPLCILTGSVKVMPLIQSIQGSSVTFTDGTTVPDVDAIIKTVGFVFHYPFLSDDIMKVKDNRMDLYGFVWPPEVNSQNATFAVIGAIGQAGAINPAAELQCRWAAKVFKNGSNLPPVSVMMKEVKKWQKEESERYLMTPRHTMKVDYIPYTNYLARKVGCQPRLLYLLLTDCRLGLACIFGLCTPYQYRLHGPCHWSGARDAILQTWDRVYYPTNGDAIYTEQNSSSLIKKVLLVCSVVAGFYGYKYMYG